MISLVAWAALQGQTDQPPRLRTLLPNGVAILVEPMPAEPAVVLTLWVQTALPAGVRHLWEHLAAKGPKGDLDQRLESAGGFLTASTLRDGTMFQISVPPDQTTLGWQAVREVLSPLSIDRSAVAREVDVIRQEGAIRAAEARLASQGWDVAYLGRGEDPFGDPGAMISAPLSDLAKPRLTAAAVVVTGKVALDTATRQAQTALAGLPKMTRSGTRNPGRPAITQTKDGEARGAIVPGIREKSTVATLMAGLSLAREFEDAFFVYTPSVQPGIVFVGGNGVGDRIERAQSRNLFSLGRESVRTWIRSYLDTGRGVGYLRGLLMVQDPALRPEGILETVEEVDFRDFEGALAGFSPDRGVVVTP